MKLFVRSFMAILVFSFVSCAKTGSLTKEEISFIKAGDKMRVFFNDDENDNLVLRTNSKEALINSDGYDVLEKHMMTALLEEKGVGIAAPQIGVNRRVIIVQRLDKDEKSLEYYYNLVITEKRGELIEGWEGCLSVPAGFGKVNRWHNIDVEYDALENGSIARKKENIVGFTAVIFQHETDHLNGVLFIDKKLDEELVPKEEYYEMRKKQKEEAQKLDTE